jgi:anaerobic magnesium-protoporphyrin IX monomethyl ester cyclase
MRISLINPNWTYTGSIYFGCRAPHLPIEFGFSKALLERAGHQAEIVDGHLEGLSNQEIRHRVETFAPQMLVVSTAPTYLFWRCPPPELRVPQELLSTLHGIASVTAAVGPHASTTPATALRKLGADVVVMGECEEVLVQLAERPPTRFVEVSSIAYLDGEKTRVQGEPLAVRLEHLPALRWSEGLLARHAHHHHRFDVPPSEMIGLGAEVEITRGCPYHCTFCNKETFRDTYRKRPLAIVLEEIDELVKRGVTYFYFIDEIFLPDRRLLEALKERKITFGVQMRIDNWTEELLDLLGRAGCLSIEAGMESISPEGRSLLAKRCKMTTEELTELLIFAKKRVPFVQANLLDAHVDEPNQIEAWRERLAEHGVWANKPVPMFPYPGTPEYRQRWGPPDDRAWERAHAFYLRAYGNFSDIQETRPLALSELERNEVDV